MTPDFRIIANGVNVTAQMKDRMLGLSISDEAGLKSDQAEITLDNRDNAITLPNDLNVPLIISTGYKETFLLPMGTYVFDEVTTKGPPDTLIIRGKAANLGGSIQNQKTRNWDDVTLGQIVRTIEHDLDPKIAQAYQDISYDHLDQTDESDINFLTRLAHDHDAMATVKGQALLFIGKGQGQTASGQPMPPVDIDKIGVIRHAMTWAKRDDFKSVEAYWQNTQTGKKEKVTEGEGSPVKKLRHTYATEDEARRAARAKLSETSRGSKTFNVTIPGNPLIAAEGQINVKGFVEGVNGTWSIVRVRHEIRLSGFTTQIEAEKTTAQATKTD